VGGGGVTFLGGRTTWGKGKEWNVISEGKGWEVSEGRTWGVTEGTPTKGRGPHHLKHKMPRLSLQGGRNFPLGASLFEGGEG
jgi:hypothetical protein